MYMDVSLLKRSAQPRHSCQRSSARPGCEKIVSFSGLFKPSPVKQARDGILQAVRDGSATIAPGLVDTLLQTRLLQTRPFREASLGGGPWQVVYTRGPLAWQVFTRSAGQTSARRGNRAAQEFCPKRRSVVNFGELWGAELFVTAQGTYTPQDDSSALPKVICASIDSGTLHAWGRRIPLPIRGTGKFTIAYLDDAVRVFCGSGSSVTVQVRQDLLEKKTA